MQKPHHSDKIGHNIVCVVYLDHSGRDYGTASVCKFLQEAGMDKKGNKHNSFSLLSIVTEAGTLGVTLAICLILGVLAGRYIDGYLDSSPWGMILFSLLGAVAGFWSLYKKMLRFMDTDNSVHVQSHQDKSKGGMK